MSCDYIQQSLSLYVDDGLTADERLTVYQHLEVCPVCRARVGELRNLRSSLAMLSTPIPPADLIPAINTALAAKAAEQRARRNATTMDAVNDWALKWLQPRPMRYAFSSLASIIIFTAVFAALRPHMIALREATLAFEQVQITTVPQAWFVAGYDITKPISPEGYAGLLVIAASDIHQAISRVETVHLRALPDCRASDPNLASITPRRSTPNSRVRLG